MKPPHIHPEDQDHNAPPLNPLPISVTLLALAIFGIELVLTGADNGVLGGARGSGWRLAAMEDYGFFEPLMSWMVQHGLMRADILMRLVTYPFIHASFTHAAFALVFLLALGKMVGEVLSNWAVLVVFFGASIAGALVYWGIWDTQVVLVGAYPGAYGLIGAYTFILWAGLAGDMQGVRAFGLIAMLMAIQLIFGLFVGGGPGWVAEFSGFTAGFALAFLVSPGGWQALLRRLRQRG
ncbi:MAG: rhomboid family intramembrane serine protease [Maritimibacter sp.]